jgi:hypothetical protein
MQPVLLVVLAALAATNGGRHTGVTLFVNKGTAPVQLEWMPATRGKCSPSRALTQINVAPGRGASLRGDEPVCYRKRGNAAAWTQWLLVEPGTEVNL